MWGSILAAVSSQLATTTDAIVVSNLIGPDAISAINLVLPVLTVFSCLMILFGIGGSIVAAKAIGRRDEETANNVFTTSVLVSAFTGVILAIFTYILSPYIINVLSSGNQRIYEYALSYLRTMCYAAPFMMIAGVIENFVKTDGNPKIVMMAVIAGSILNLILDIVFVKWLNMGIAGSAWATGLNYLLSALICILHFKNPHSSLKWNYNRKQLVTNTSQSVTQGLSMSLNTFLLGVCILILNSIILNIEGADGMYCWSVCLQLFMIMQMVLAGIGSSIYAIGGILVGEQDMKGLSILNSKCIMYAGGALLTVTILIIIFPEFFGQLFGSKSGNSIQILPYTLRAFSLLLVPYAIVALLRSTYQILGHNKLSLLLSIFQLVLMVGFVYGFSFISGNVMWLGFPSSSYSLLLFVIAYSFTLNNRNHSIKPITLIPEHEDNSTLNISVRMDYEDVAKAESEITNFLELQNLNIEIAYKIRLSCEELMYNIVNYAIKKKKEKHFFDLHIRCNPKTVNVLIKDDGRPFNPILKDENNTYHYQDSTKLGLTLVNKSTDSINYKYMYNQNVIMLTFQKNEL